MQKYSIQLNQIERGTAGNVMTDVYCSSVVDAEIARLKQAIQWILSNGAALCLDGQVRDGNDDILEIPAEFADLIKV